MFQETTTRCVGSTTRLQHARIVQQEVTRLLLSARESLLGDLADMARLLPSWQQRALEIAQNTHKEITKVPIGYTPYSHVTTPYTGCFRAVLAERMHTLL